MTEERTNERQERKRGTNTCTRNLYSSSSCGPRGGAWRYTQNVSIRTYEYRQRWKKRELVKREIEKEERDQRMEQIEKKKKSFL